VEGTNVRVHTIGSEVFATSISADSTDYRYGNAELKTFELSDELSKKCVKLSQALGLDFAGIDLKITPEGRIFCFEVNPSPAFSYYEANTGQPISKALALYLAGGE
jgi:glutathione synthase/RimK-type ligase-like ATP-grasp enzyme